MCTVLLPQGVDPIAVNKYIIYQKGLIRGTQNFEKSAKSKIQYPFMCPCIGVTIINDDQHDATIFGLLISSLLYMFRAALSPIIRST
jgi:hypothetical protein